MEVLSAYLIFMQLSEFVLHDIGADAEEPQYSVLLFCIKGTELPHSNTLNVSV